MVSIALQSPTGRCKTGVQFPPAPIGDTSPKEMVMQKRLVKREHMFKHDGVSFRTESGDLDRFVTSMDALFMRLYELQEKGYKVRLVREEGKNLTFVRVVHDSSEMMGGAIFYKRQLLFKTDFDQHIVVSAVKHKDRLFETYLFLANEHGEIEDFMELDGSQRGTNDIYQVLREAGYSVKEGQGPKGGTQ